MSLRNYKFNHLGHIGILRLVRKVWGIEEWLVNNELYCLKKLILFPGGCCSLHSHPIKDETFFGLVGRPRIELGSKSFVLLPSSHIRIPPNTRHRFSLAADAREAIFFEVSTHHDDDDVIRYEPSKLAEEE